MPWTITYGARGVDLQFRERCDGTDVKAAHEAVYRHHYDEGLQYIVVDFAPVQYLDLSLADVLSIAEHDRQYLLRNPPHLLAMIAPQAPVLGLLRSYEHYMQGSSLHVTIVSCRNEALAWLQAQMLESVA